MSKKSRRKQLSEKVLQTKRREKHTEKKPNPFELKFNKQKHVVAGQRKQASAVGLPLLSRQRAFEQRKRTLLTEYRRIGKANEIVDRRLGERNPNLTPDQKMALRFAAERARRYKSGGATAADDHSPSNFQLSGVDSILTHRGKALSEIEKLNDRPLLDDEDEEGERVLGADFVKLAHFGGGNEKNKGNANDDATETGERKKTRKELIEEMIENSKRARFEIQMQREKASDLTADLDAQWKEAVRENVVSQWVRPSRGDDQVESEKVKNRATSSDGLDYDRLVHEMAFEPKGAAGAEKSKKTQGGTATIEDDDTNSTGAVADRSQSKKLARNHTTGDDDIGDTQRRKKEKVKPVVVQYDSEGRLVQNESTDVREGEASVPPKKRSASGIEFLEPRIETNFNPERKKRRITGKGEEAERQKLMQKYKKELRGTIRELRKDNEFLARQQLLEQRQEDAQRRDKVKSLMKSLVSQETECRKLKKKKNL